MILMVGVDDLPCDSRRAGKTEFEIWRDGLPTHQMMTTAQLLKGEMSILLMTVDVSR